VNWRVHVTCNLNFFYWTWRNFQGQRQSCSMWCSGGNF